MKITVLLGRYPPVFGGATPTLVTLFSEIAARGHEVVFLTPRYSASHPKQESHKGIKVFRIGSGLGNSFSELMFVLNALRFISKERLNTEVLVDTIPYGIAMPFLQYYTKQKKIPLVARLSQVGTNEPVAAMTGKSGIISRLFVNGYDFTICISTALENRCAVAGIQGSRFSKIYNCVDGEKFSPLQSPSQIADLQSELLPKAKRPIVIVPGSISPRKRSHLALAAWRIIKQEYRLEGTLLFVGPLNSSGQAFNSQYVHSILEDVQAYGLQDSVFFTGQKSDINHYYQISDLLLFVSNREGLPNVLLEGLSCGLPIVCTEIKDITGDIFRNEVEGLYTADCPRAIAEKLSLLMSNNKLRLEMSIRCRERSKMFWTNEIANEVESLLENLMINYQG